MPGSGRAPTGESKCVGLCVGGLASSSCIQHSILEEARDYIIFSYFIPLPIPHDPGHPIEMAVTSPPPADPPIDGWLRACGSLVKTVLLVVEPWVVVFCYSCFLPQTPLSWMVLSNVVQVGQTEPSQLRGHARLHKDYLLRALRCK